MRVQAAGVQAPRPLALGARVPGFRMASHNVGGMRSPGIVDELVCSWHEQNLHLVAVQETWIGGANGAHTPRVSFLL